MALTVLPRNSPDRRERVSAQQPVILPSVDPHQALTDVVAEQAVIGIVLQHDYMYPALGDILQPGDFSMLWHGYVWLAFEKIDGRGEKIDTLMVLKELERHDGFSEERDTQRLTELMSVSYKLDNAESYARRVRDAATKLRMLRTLDEMKALVLDKTTNGFVEQLVDLCNEKFFVATEQRGDIDTSAKSMMNATVDRIESAMQSGKDIGTQTGFYRLDKLTNGLYPREVTVMVGSDGMGKTSWLLSCVRNVLKRGKNVVMFSLEMSQEEVGRILLSQETGVSKDVLKSGKLNHNQWQLVINAASEIAKWQIHVIDEYKALTPIQLRRRLRKLKATQPVDLVVIDGLWLMEATVSKEKRFEDVANIMRDLTEIAKTFDLPILIAHQYNGDAWSRTDKRKRPITKDIAESAGVRRTAQVILGLYRDAYYKIEGDKDVTELHILKDRNGVATGEVVDFTFNRTSALYTEVEPHVHI